MVLSVNIRLLVPLGIVIFILSTEYIHGKSVTQGTNYPQACYAAACDNRKFMSWRRSKHCQTIVENMTYEQGFEYLQNIKKNYPAFIKHLEKLGLEDKVGSPISFRYPVGRCSPIVLRYVKIAGDLQKEFGDLNGLNIVEIGGGFGGQCKILHDLVPFASYTIIDLPGCVPYIRRYLNYFNIKNVHVMDCTKVNSPLYFDLVISNYAVSEIDKAEQLNYMKNIINFAPRGYIIYDFSTSLPEIGNFTIQEFVSQISVPNRKIGIEHENPSTNSTNFLIIWGSK